MKPQMHFCSLVVCGVCLLALGCSKEASSEVVHREPASEQFKILEERSKYRDEKILEEIAKLRDEIRKLTALASGPPLEPSGEAPYPAKKVCISNLRQIEGAIESWALENKKTEGNSTVGAERAINAFLRGGQAPVCPAGGTYIYGKVGEAPRCTLAASGHTL